MAQDGAAADAADPMQIHAPMGVIGSDGGRVGIVDRLEGDRIRLAQPDRDAGARHVPVGMIAAVDDENVYLDTPARNACRLAHVPAEPPEQPLLR
jgi:hypothetical protein